jgi:hypothetical protein
MLLLPAAFGQQPPADPNPATDPAHRLTGGEFLGDIGSNFAALISTKSIVPVVAGTAAYSLATIPEQRIETHFSRGDVWGAWGNGGKYMGNPIVLGGISGTLFAVSRKSTNRRFRSLSYSLIHGMIMSSAIAQPLKFGFGRLRPNGEDHFAFPSGWKAAIPGYALAAYVASTRLEDRKHHLTDVVGGATIGYLVGRTVSRRIRGGKESRFGWDIRPSGKGFVGTVRVALP